MYKLILFLRIYLAFALGSEQTKHAEHSEKVVACYYDITMPHNDPQPVLVNIGIDASLCNYLIYGFVGVGPNASVLDDNVFRDKASEKLQHFDARWKNNHQIKILAHLHSLNDPHASNMQNVLYDPHMREKVVKNVVNFVKEYAFNGIDLDFSYVYIVNEHTNADKENLVLLLKALKSEFNKADLILSVSADPRQQSADMLYNIKGISQYADFINLVPFNSREPLYQNNIGSVEHTSTHSHSLNKNPEQSKKSIHDFVTHWMDNDVPPNKLIFGITLNGPSYTANLPKESCTMSMKYNVDPMKERATYVNKMKLGGVVVRNLDQDDVHGTCGEKFAALKALNQILKSKS